MMTELLDILCCPDCQGDLRLHRGSLECLRCHRSYPVEDGIPFFSPATDHKGVQNQQSTYSTWWDEYHDEKSIVDEKSRDFFFNSLRIRAEEFEGKVVLDGGCGNGRFSYVVSHYRPRLLVSFDISSGLLHARRAISKRSPEARVAYVQGDITRPPFKKGVFDLVFSWGVIHHTPDTSRTFSTLSGLVRPGGILGVYVYEFHPLYQFDRQRFSFLAYLRSLCLIRPLRSLCSRLPARWVHRLFVPLYYLERFFNVGVLGCHGSSENRWEKGRYFRVVIDRFKTRYASEHQMEEVIGWFRQNGFDRLRVGSSPRVSVSGVRSGEKQTSSMTVSIFNQWENDESIARYFPQSLQKTGS